MTHSYRLAQELYKEFIAECGLEARYREYVEFCGIRTLGYFRDSHHIKLSAHEKETDYCLAIFLKMDSDGYVQVPDRFKELCVATLTKKQWTQKEIPFKKSFWK